MCRSINIVTDVHRLERSPSLTDDLLQSYIKYKLIDTKKDIWIEYVLVFFDCAVCLVYDVNCYCDNINWDGGDVHCDDNKDLVILNLFLSVIAL